ncbi:MAG: 2-hydroxyacid dehydrogenase [Longimicrobiales bacterium]
MFVTRRIPEAGLEMLRHEDVDVGVGQEDDEAGLDRESLLRGARSARVLVSLLTESIDREVLEAGSRLRGVANYAVGYDNVDVETATELGIPVSNTPGVLTDTTADLAWALLMASARRVVEADRYVRSGRFGIWGPNLLLGADVSPGGSGRRKVLGIVGFGRIGRAMARRASGFDMEVVAADPRHRNRVEEAGYTWVELEELLERSDFVSLHVPLTGETRHLVDEDAFRRMKSTAHLVNVARGPVVDETALVRALREEWIAGAGLDVFEDEPELTPGLSELPNVVLAPHIGSGSRDTRGKMARIAATNALQHIRGEEAANTVNPEVYETAAWRRRRGSTG